MLISATQNQSLRTPQQFEAACAGRSDLDWMPDIESTNVPAAQAELCRTCPGRADCLVMALRSGAEGYWAATTTAEQAPAAQTSELWFRTSVSNGGVLMSLSEGQGTRPAVMPATNCL